MHFNSLFPLLIGLSVWIYGTFLLVNKLKSEISYKKTPEETQTKINL